MSGEAINAYVQAQRERFLDELKELVAIPSISALSEHKADVQRAAEWLAGQLREHAAMPTVEVIATAGHPLVYAERLGKVGQPTLLIYGHYDVQPVDPIGLWRTPPFEATVSGDNLYGRGASDDKGPTLATIKALETLQALHGELPINVKVLIEGEEEISGEAIKNYVRGNPERLAADAVLILDTGMVMPGVPTLTYGLRGMAYCEIEARGAAGDLHSGMYGGIAPNPIQALAWILAELKRPDGSIQLPGLYEMMRPPSAEERAIFERQSEAGEAALREAAGLEALVGEEGYSVMERKTARPTFEVHGIVGGFVGEGAKTVIPARAVAKVSLRLVPEMDPARVAELLAARVAELTPAGITSEVRVLGLGEPVGVPLDAPALQTAAAALEQEFGHATEFVREGGSIPIAALFASVLGAPVVMMGFGLADDNLHAPNEKFFIPNYYAAIRSVAGFVERLGRAAV
jgi:acetylornithine deacetylase/succinyl-diaminopimelate desuccinylase-like protein